MSKSPSTETDTSIKRAITQFKNDLEAAKLIGPEAVLKIMANINAAALPPSKELDELKRAIDTAMEAAIKIEKEKILAATQHEAENNSGVNVKPTWDDHIKQRHKEFDGLNKSLKKEDKEERIFFNTLLEDLEANKGISSDSIQRLKDQLSPEAIAIQDNTWKKMEETKRDMTLDRQWRKFEKEKIEDEAKTYGMQLDNPNQQGLDDKLVARKEQLNKEWEEHTTNIEKADKVLKKIDKRYKELEGRSEELAKAIEVAKAKEIPNDHISYLEQRQQYLNSKIPRNHDTKKQLINPVLGLPNSLQEQTITKSGITVDSSTQKPNKITTLDGKGQEKLGQPKGTKSTAPLTKPNDKKSDPHPNGKIVVEARDIAKSVKQKLTHNNPPADKNGKLVTMPPPPVDRTTSRRI
jgi:hypothetical protein